jgi:hypothetical protein
MQESGSMESKDDLQKIRIGAVEQLGARPKVLKELQELVPLLAVAYSTDGRTFGYEAPLSMPIPIGSYVALSVENGGEYLGQVVTKEVSVRQGGFSDLERHEQGLVLRMDPLRDREEFNAYWRAIEGLSRESYSLSEVKENVVRQYSEEARKLGLRIENLGVADWSLWCSADEPSLVDVMEEDWRCLVVDSGRLVLSSG